VRIATRLRRGEALYEDEDSNEADGVATDATSSRR
jgi:hypothetical protein